MLTTYIAGAEELYEGKVSKDKVGIKAVDELHTRSHLRQLLRFTLMCSACGVMHRKQKQRIAALTAGQCHQRHMYPTGFQGQFNKNGRRCGHEENEHYWDAGNVKLSEVNFRFILEPSTALTAFEKGEIDGFRTILTSDIPRLRATSEAFHVIPSFGTTFYDVNNTRKPYSDPRVRRALALALDRQELLDNVLQTPDRPTMAIVSPGYVVGGEDFTEYHKKYGFNPRASVAEAKKLLSEGYPTERASQSLNFPTTQMQL